MQANAGHQSDVRIEKIIQYCDCVMIFDTLCVRFTHHIVKIMLIFDVLNVQNPICIIILAAHNSSTASMKRAVI